MINRFLKLFLTNNLENLHNHEIERTKKNIYFDIKYEYCIQSIV